MLDPHQSTPGSPVDGMPSTRQNIKIVDGASLDFDVITGS